MHRKTQKHLNYVPWEPSRAAVSRVDQSKQIQSNDVPSISTQLYRYQSGNKSPLTAVNAKETIPMNSKAKPTATVEPFQASINADEIFYGVRLGEVEP